MQMEKRGGNELKSLKKKGWDDREVVRSTRPKKRKPYTLQETKDTCPMMGYIILIL